jgi:hypothetical protein
MEERWRNYGGAMEEYSRFIANSSLFYMCLRLVSGIFFVDAKQ